MTDRTSKDGEDRKEQPFKKLPKENTCSSESSTPLPEAKRQNPRMKVIEVLKLTLPIIAALLTVIEYILRVLLC